LGTKDTINSGPLVSGLVQKVRQTITTTEEDESATTVTEETTTEKMEVVEDEDERARRALLASVSGEDNEDISIDIIPIASNAYKGPMDETEAYKEDLATRPESATLDDYERVPVSQFGAALLRGMGWKPGTAASRTRKGPVEPYLPSSRPSLLGLGAKERPTEEIPGAGLKGVKVNTRPERKYIPIVQVKRQVRASTHHQCIFLTFHRRILSGPHLHVLNRAHHHHIAMYLAYPHLGLLHPTLRMIEKVEDTRRKTAVALATALRSATMTAETIMTVITVVNARGTAMADCVETQNGIGVWIEAVIINPMAEILVGTGTGIVVESETATMRRRGTTERILIDEIGDETESLKDLFRIC